MNKQMFWKMMMAGSLFGWAFIFFGVFFPFEGGVIKVLWLFVLLGFPIKLPDNKLNNFLQLMGCLSICCVFHFTNDMFANT